METIFLPFFRWEQELGNQSKAPKSLSTTTSKPTQNPQLSAAVVNSTENGTVQVAPSPTPVLTTPSGPTFIPDPCLPVGLKMPQKRANSSLRGAGDLQGCLHGLRDHLLDLDKPCTEPPCSMAGVHQPALDYLKTEFYGFSEFWYTSNDILNLGGRYNHRQFFVASKVGSRIFVSI